MDLAIPPEFEAFAREQVESGASASAEQVVAGALHDRLARVAAPKGEIAKGPAPLGRGEDVDGIAAPGVPTAESESRSGA